MKILKTMTTLAFACACLFTFAGCDWFGNSGTLIAEPTDTQLNLISGAVANMEAYTGDYTITASEEENFYSSADYLPSGTVTGTMVERRKGTGDSMVGYQKTTITEKSESINVQTTYTGTEEKYIGKVGEEYLRLDLTDQTKRTYTTMEALISSTGIGVLEIQESELLDDLTGYTTDELQIYALSEDDTSFRIVLTSTTYDEDLEENSTNKYVSTFEATLITVNGTLLFSTFEENTLIYERKNTTDSWGELNGKRYFLYNYDYSSMSIVLPDATNYEEDI